MKKASDYFFKFVNIGFSAIFILFSFYMIFFPNIQHKEFKTDVPKVLLFAVLFCFIQFIWYKLLSSLDKKRANVVRIIVYGLLFVFQVFLFWKTYTVFGWDSVVVRDAGCSGFDGDVLYFAKWPNNLFTAVIMRGWVLATDFLMFLSPILRLTMLNLVFADMGLLIGYLCVSKMFDRLTADSFILPAIFLVGLSPWMAVHYTDTLGTLFPITSIYFLLCGREAEKTSHRNIFTALAVFVSVLGAYVKLTSIIVVIAYAITLLIKNEIRFNRKFLSLVLSVLIGSAAAFSVFYISTSYPRQRIKETVPDVKARGFYYFLETGITGYGYGIWSLDTFEFTNEHINDKDYERQARARIADVLKGYGVAGTLKHLYLKLIWDGTDGTFLYGGEGDFHHEAQADQSTLRGKLQNYIYVNNAFYKNVLAQWLQGVWLRICTQCAFSFFFKDDKKDIIFISKLAIGGLFLFLMIFENRSRYVFLYVPVIIMTAQAGITGLKQKIREDKLRDRK